MQLPSSPIIRRLRWLACALSVSLAGLLATAAHAAISLADTPLFSTLSVPGNLILALSVEWPTATTPAYPSTTAYASSGTFLGYFDPAKCYNYVPVNIGTATNPDYSTSYFVPNSMASNHTCVSTASLPLWSGNYLNWAFMQTLDTFRWVLTGGYRSVDTPTNTVLTKTYAGYDSEVMPDKTSLGAQDVSGWTPFNWASVSTRVRNLGTAIYLEYGSSFNCCSPGITDYTGQNSAARTADTGAIYRLYVNVQVCNPNVGLESNCVAYSSASKPEGLMQTYSQKLRYSAFGYINDSDYMLDGGVMRARMKYIGPNQPVPGSAPIGNSNNEWDAGTGVMTVNPDPTDATATQNTAAAAGWSGITITQSGVMNYLNKFGYAAKTYKSYDPVSELYYAALRYYKNLGAVGSYLPLANAGSISNAKSWLDNFPAIIDDAVWRSNGSPYGSSILYSCQKNFILGIGDVNTWHDNDLPGAAMHASTEPTTPPEVTADTTVNAATATNMVGKLEGLQGTATLAQIYGDQGNTNCPSQGNQCNTYDIAGLAYDSHVIDIRPDLAGTQTVSTYWMDVEENQVYKHKNQYWLASKYGGFAVPTAFSPYATTNGPTTLPLASWYNSTDTLAIGTGGLGYTTDTGAHDYRPDNYFPGNQADTMKTGLTNAFAKIVAEASSVTSTSLSEVSLNVPQAGAINYSASYDPRTWTGDLVAATASYDGNGAVTTTPVWSASAKLSAMVTATDTSARMIVTCCKSDNTALPFTASSLGVATLIGRTNYASFANVPGASSQSAANYLAYLRGATSQEIANGGAYRNRGGLLGDIVNSKPVAVGAPSAQYYDLNNAGYSTFKGMQASRKTVVYVGANDGMLHAFDGSNGAVTSGNELFAYVPSFVYGTTSTAGTIGLASLGNPSFSHHYLVDGTPVVADVDMSKTVQANAGGNDWHTVLVEGLGKGGTGYFAIDVTDPSTWTNESNVSSKVLWEFTDPRMGYTYGTPSIVKTKKYGWVVIMTSGFNNADGVGYVFFVNPRNGQLLETVAMPEGSTTTPLNMAEHIAFVPDFTDGTTDAIYAGDLQGNLWRVDVSSGSNSPYPTPLKIAKLTNAAGAALPVTTRPLVEFDPDSKRRFVLVGTGRLLADSDISDADLQAFFAIADGTSTFGAFYTGATLPAPASFPITRSQLAPNNNLLQGIGSNPPSSMGWYFDFAANNGIGARVDVQPVENNGVIAFATNLPNGDACNPGGVGSLYSVNLTTGQTVLTDSAGNLMVTHPSPSTITEVSIQRVNGSLRLYYGNTNGDKTQAPASLARDASLKQLGWHEVKTNE